MQNEEELMPKQLSGIGLSLALLLTTSAGPTAAQQSGSSQVTIQPAIECGGQYECVEGRPLTQAEARASLGYPQSAQAQEPIRQEAPQVAATDPTKTK
jgi:hypothetical protein